MSYWDLPRINFTGKFFTDPSTINNDPSHYDPANLKPSRWQDPKGMHTFKILEAAVTAGMDRDGEPWLGGDLLIGARVLTTDLPTPAKLVDLDVYQQGVPAIYALQLQIQLDGGPALTGDLHPCAFSGIWFNRVLPTRGWNPWDSYGEDSFGGDTNASGSYQSVLRVTPANWPARGISPLLDQLQARTAKDQEGNWLVSIRLTLDGYQNVPEHKDVHTGRMLGTLGPVLSPSEPRHLPGGRWLAARHVVIDPNDPSKTSPWYMPDLYDVPFRFAERDNGDQVLVCDLSNGLPMQTAGGYPVPLGELLFRLSTGGVIGSVQVNESLYTSLGAIVEIPVPKELWSGRNVPLSITCSVPDIAATGPLWTEDQSGFWMATENRVQRMTSEPESEQRTADVRIYATTWGAPAAGMADLKVAVVPVTNGIKGATVPWPAGYVGDTPEAEGKLQASITPTNGDGWATVHLEVTGDPGARTPWLDSQLYFVVPYRGATPPNLKTAPAAQESMISVVAWAAFPVQTDPSWDTVRGILMPYVRLFPGMTDLIDTSDFHTFQTFATNPPWSIPNGPVNFNPPTPYVLPDGKTIDRGSISFMLTRPLHDSRYMPVTRDLSPNKRLTILYFIWNLIQRVPSTIPSADLPMEPRS